MTPLLDRDGFGEIPGLVDIGAHDNGSMVGQKLHREGIDHRGEGCVATIEMPEVHPLIAPLVYAVPVQLLAYHVAVAKGTDVDQPRNLAKSVTVE